MNGRAPSLLLATLSVLQGWQLFVLTDLRARIARLEDRAITAAHGR